jgi:hypothetical protein
MMSLIHAAYMHTYSKSIPKICHCIRQFYFYIFMYEVQFD